MCGISVFFDRKKSSNINYSIKKMIDQLDHRGPDGNNFWSNQELGIAIGHNRLSVIDLSDNGSQPMKSCNGRYIISFNGEIYNFLYLKKKIDKKYKVAWVGKSDTEVLINFIELFGIDYALSEIDGMYSFVLYDLKLNHLFLVRDKFGEKPMYYYKNKNIFAAASEIKSLLTIDNIDQSINDLALQNFYKNAYIPANLTIYRHIHKLEQGNILKINLNDNKNMMYEKKVFYNYELSRKKSYENNSEFLNESIITKKIETALEESILTRKISDRNLGTFLSSGKDSALITSILQKNSLNKIDTFCLALEDKNFDESQAAEKISKHLKTNFHKILLKNNEIKNSFEDMINIFDEPFGDSSSILMYHLSKHAKEKVTVCLTGDGSDEIFGGYNRYYKLLKIKKLRNNFFKFFFNNLEKIVSKKPYLLDNLICKKLLGKKNLYQSFKSLNFYLNEPNLAKIYEQMSNFNYNIFDNKNPNVTLSQNYRDNEIEEYMLVLDFVKYLPGDILVKSDRASMAHGLELRLPFLNEKIISEISKISSPNLFKKYPNKKILNNILKKYIPEKLFVKKEKKGFTAPINNWLRHELKYEAQSLLNTKPISEIDEIILTKTKHFFKLHLDNKGDYGNLIWNCLIFQSFKIKKNI